VIRAIAIDSRIHRKEAKETEDLLLLNFFAKPFEFFAPSRWIFTLYASYFPFL